MDIFKKFLFVIVLVILLGNSHVKGGPLTTSAAALKCATICMDAALLETMPQVAIVTRLVEMSTVVSNLSNPFLFVGAFIGSAVSPLKCASCLLTLAATISSPV